jgi:Protein of unknown function (DUF4232)
MTSSATLARRVLGAAVPATLVALALTGCGSASPKAAPTVTVTRTRSPSSPTATSPPAPSPSPSPTVTGLSGCTTPYLKALVGPEGVAAGSAYYPIELTNIANSSCTLYGFPGVSFVTHVDGSQIGPAATENPIRPRRLVKLAPGKTASALLQVVNAANYPARRCKPVTAHWLKVYPPGETSALYYNFSATICSASSSVPSLSIGTMQPGRTGL